MDYAEYVNRRPPSPPPIRAPFPSPLSPSPIPPTLEPIGNRPVASLLHRRALFSEYNSLASQLRASHSIQTQRDRHEAVRIRLEDLLTCADDRAERVLHMALAKCNSSLDNLVDRIRTLDEAQVRMRVIESKHFLGTPPSPRTQHLRTIHVRRESLATLVDQIATTLQDQIRIHHMLSILFSKANDLRTNLANMDRDDRPHSQLETHRSASAISPTSADSTPPETRKPFGRRVSRSSFRGVDPLTPSTTPDRPVNRANRGSALRSQRSLPRRSDGGLLPFVVKRALSYNAAQVPGELSETASSDASWWNDTSGKVGRSAPKLSLPDVQRATWGERSRKDVGNSADTLSSHTFRPEDEIADDELFPPVSPVSQCTASDGSPRTDSKGYRGFRTDSAFDRSVLVDIDSLCTEASSVLSSHREDRKPSRKGSVPSGSFGLTRPLSKLRFGFLRGHANVKKMWGEINELYKVVLTHGPHLLEEKMVTRASIAQGILGPWTPPRIGKAASFRTGIQAAAVAEACRKIESVLIWQLRLVVAIRRDFLQQRKSLRQADAVISQEFIRTFDKMGR
eukprot:GFKZ01009026.1.p1 GENE.GFKZ01009026.1~~GFKZ01009026.1.p1  ORF type:complete len:585 (+),score=74.15 GFKZ01009026.1:55-1755(+)